ncbi:hypothetical protein CSIM01_13512 [Colletotrichum simmondsii]|uniref:Uncharacterized protein n=1 Tax=Colletotrichum simmondsii TaxID=703756 RepID=A0A135T3P8_9PEZI|nr:hypothetical protein CSIM01_13512 [Colletotrichum simmondsii]
MKPLAVPIHGNATCLPRADLVSIFSIDPSLFAPTASASASLACQTRPILLQGLPSTSPPSPRPLPAFVILPGPVQESGFHNFFQNSAFIVAPRMPYCTQYANMDVDNNPRICEGSMGKGSRISRTTGIASLGHKICLPRRPTSLPRSRVFALHRGPLQQQRSTGLLLPYSLQDDDVENTVQTAPEASRAGSDSSVQTFRWHATDAPSCVILPPNGQPPDELLS